MKQWNGLWLPDDEQRLIEWMTKVGHTRDGIPTYQYSKYERAVAEVPERMVAIDIGAHIGQWSMWLGEDFHYCVAFEPVERYQECWRRNTQRVKHNVTLEPIALGAGARAQVNLECVTPGSNGDTVVVENEPHMEDGITAEMRTLDSYEVEHVSFIKIDCEGYELPVLKGGEQTIKRSMPIIIVEQKPGKAQAYGYEETEAVSWLIERGYCVAKKMSGDYIMRPFDGVR